MINGVFIHMKRTGDDIERLRSELKNDEIQIGELYLTNHKAIERIKNGAEDYLDYAALGYTIHNLYSLMENACFRIAKFFENNLTNDSWHRELLDRMILDIEDVRPAFLNRETYLILDDMRAFRHLFRNLYARPIDSDKVLLIQKNIPEAVSGFREAIGKYLDFLRDMKKAINT